MSKWNRKPDIDTLRTMAKEARDPVVAQALLDLANEYERLAQEKTAKVA